MASIEKLPSDALIKSASLASLSPDLGKYAQVSELLTQIAKALLPDSSHPIGGIMNDNTWSCEVLAPGSAWRKGRLSLNIEVEFLSEDPAISLVEEPAPPVEEPLEEEAPPVADPISQDEPTTVSSRPAMMDVAPETESAFPGTVLDLD